MRVSVSLGVACAVLALACGTEPVDQQALLTARDLGLSDLQQGRLVQAEAQFKTVVSLAPRDPLGYANLGLTYLQAGRFDEAEPPLRRAQRLDPQNADVALIMARLYALTDRVAEARETLIALGRNARAAYALAELERETAEGGAASPAYAQRLRDALALAPANLAIRLRLVDALMRRHQTDSVVRHLEAVRRLRPEPPAEARPHLAAALRHLRAGNLVPARESLDRFLRLMDVTAPYQAALAEVQWTEGPLVGRPVLSFAPQSVITMRGIIPASRRTEVQFVDVTAEAGLMEAAGASAPPTALAMGDYDGDGEDNLLVVTPQALRLYNVRGGFLADVTARMSLPGALSPGAAAATFADYDNDGWLDLFAIGANGRGHLLRNVDGRRFEDVTAAAGVGEVGADAHQALFADLDHDGDLDLLLVGGASPRLLRNNLDGTFSDVPRAAGLAGAGGAGGAAAAAFADFDGDGRVDVVLAGEAGPVLLRGNSVEGFQDVTAASGLAGAPGAAAVAVGDYNNDGALDLVLVGAETALWRNEGDGRFTADRRHPAPGAARPDGGAFFDYDNDGWLDLIVAGSRGLRLYRNDGAGRFTDRSDVLPDRPTDAAAVTGLLITDIDADGDRDLLTGDAAGAHLLRNDGGNARLAMQVQLVALRTGSGKNNNFGIGARLEVRAGELYQTRVVTDRVTHFGLGSHLKADVLRVQWPNGVPQTVYFPGTDEDVLELELLKGSCAFLYTWDGTRFRFVTDVMWRSALGMPMGIMGGKPETGGGTGETMTYAPAGASQEYLRIPGDALRPRDGSYILQVTEELWETAYVDEIRLLAVDHPDSVAVFVDERFVPPGPVDLRIYQTVRPRPPRSAVDERGANVLPALRERDDVYVSNLRPERYQGVVEPHDLILDLGEDAGRQGSVLVLRGWIYPTDASINVALSQQTDLAVQLPSLEVRDARGRWTTAIP
ncbi:MAG: FG-GAP-like repeat-containing protein, partial [Gemmatimonadales bacterium]